MALHSNNHECYDTTAGLDNVLPPYILDWIYSEGV